ncbi:carbamate kinase [Klebsiella oxytoca]|uniref:Carbamate kinase n=1 Tax=Klebsiella oxytoca TaxID=571 RepID=A0A6B8MZR9_KLEOX|nr:carbamate kinase [Klebsiella oxytoca]QGN40219.1 carbamate kinase [Klebsiella oxytoca]
MVKTKIAVVAVGGNALIRNPGENALEQQYEAVKATAENVVDLIAAGWRVVLTHGNGPQVGFILRRSEIAKDAVPGVPLEYAVGDTQGAIGFMFQNALNNALSARGIATTPVVALVTQTLIDPNDSAFSHPDKPIGDYMTQETAETLANAQGWDIAEDSGRGWRRVVASPAPQEVIETPVIRTLLEQNVLVIACGGGGIPVWRDASGKLIAAQAVIDKDRASALLACELQADMLLIPTGVERVAINFGTPEQRWLDTLTLAEAQTLLASGQFGAGSMAPKVEAMLTYLRGNPAGVGLITSPEAIVRAIGGNGGTRFIG